MVHLSEQFTPENSSHPNISWSQLLKKFVYVAPMATLFFPPHMQLISSMECYHFWMFPFFFKAPPPPPDRMWYALYYITSRKHILTITLIPSHNNTTHKNTDFLHCRSQPLCGDWRMQSSSSCTWRAKLVVHSPACNKSKAATITKKDRLYYIGKTFIAWPITLYYRAAIQHVLLS